MHSVFTILTKRRKYLILFACLWCDWLEKIGEMAKVTEKRARTSHSPYVTPVEGRAMVTG